MTKTVLMCPPTYFDVEYEINPWMDTNNKVDKAKVAKEWQKLNQIYTNQLGWDVEVLQQSKELVDQVFATDWGLVIDGKVMLSNFRYPQRQGESDKFMDWLLEHGYKDIQKARNHFEGCGDALIIGDKILVGYGFRTDIKTHEELADFFGREVVSLKLTDPKFFHLDTPLAILDGDTVAIYPPALDKASYQRLKAAVPNIIEATLEEADGFGLNAVSDGHNVICADSSPTLANKYRAAGFNVIETKMDEFRKSGGSVKCLTLDLRV